MASIADSEHYLESSKKKFLVWADDQQAYEDYDGWNLGRIHIHVRLEHGDEYHIHVYALPGARDGERDKVFADLKLLANKTA